MSAEQLPGAERREQSEHTKAELEQAGREKLSELLEQSKENAPENAQERAEKAREVIHQSKEQAPAPAAETESAEPAAPKPKLPFHLPQLNYTQTVASMQKHLTPASRRFSQVIHAPAVEKASAALEQTVARPSVTAGATWTALIIGGVFYFTARRYGFELSGSEVSLSFVVGAALGIGVEALWRTYRQTHKHRRAHRAHHTAKHS